RADEPPRPRDEGNADDRPGAIRRDDDLRLARPHVPARSQQSRAGARRRVGPRRAAARLSGLLRRVRRAQRPRGAGSATVGPWVHGSMGPWVHGERRALVPTDPWTYGLMDPPLFFRRRPRFV